MSYDPIQSWNAHTKRSQGIAYPAEGVIRIFKGTFPDLLMPKVEPGQRIVDIGCGDGRHLPLFHDLGLDVHGVEISPEMVETIQSTMKDLSIPATVVCGHAADIPYEDEHFDFLLTWNSCYYMTKGGAQFQDHVNEMARVIKPGGWIVCSMPKRNAFIFKDSVPAERPGERVIQNDYFGIRDGEILRCMESRRDIEDSFGEKFDTFCHADIDMDWFGLAYHWYVFVARKI